jgi:AraC-like DNA-binding protein
MDAKKRFLTLDDLYISPFTKVRRFDDNGMPVYSPLERNLQPTGIYAADHLLQSLTNGENTLTAIANRLGCSGRDLSGLVRCLTGIPSEDFRNQYRQRLVDDLLRFTSLSLVEVANHSGIGSERNLYSFCRRQYGCTPADRRNKIRQVGDEGRFGL